MTTNAFGIEHGPIAKGVVADWKTDAREAKNFQKENRVGYTGKKGERLRTVKRTGRHRRMVLPGPDRKANWKMIGEHTAKGTAGGAAAGALVGGALRGKAGAITGAATGGLGGFYAGTISGNALMNARANRRGMEESVKAGDMRRIKPGEKVNWKGRIADKSTGKQVSKAFSEPVEKGLGSALMSAGRTAQAGFRGAARATKLGIRSQVQKPAVQAGVKAYKATKLGVTPGPMTANRAASHVGIAAGHATTAGGAAVGVGGVAVGAGGMALAKRPKQQGAVAKSFGSSWKTIDQRERAQARNRRHASNVAAYGSLATSAGAIQTILGPKTQTDLARMGQNAASGYKFRTKANKQLSSVKVASIKGNRVGDVGRAFRAAAATPKAAAGKTAAALMVGGVAVGAGAHGAASARNAYHQHKINERRRGRMASVTDS